MMNEIGRRRRRREEGGILDLLRGFRPTVLRSTADDEHGRHQQPTGHATRSTPSRLGCDRTDGPTAPLPLESLRLDAALLQERVVSHGWIRDALERATEILHIAPEPTQHHGLIVLQQRGRKHIT